MRKILIVVGTRPEAIKLLPVYLEFKKNSKWNTKLISTGQHKQMLWSIFNFFDVRPDHDLEIMTSNQTLPMLNAQILQRCTELFISEQPDLVIVQGDTTTAMASALCAFYQGVPLAHVEAGLRSYDIRSPFPEEVNRRIISLVAQLHFAPTKTAASAVRREKVSGKIYNVGNTVIDSLFFTLKKIKKRFKELERKYQLMIKEFEKIVLITGHRRENFGKNFTNICDALQTLAQKYPNVAWVYPVHLNPNVRQIVFERLNNIKNIFLIEPVSYDHMVFFMKKSYFIITDSGGIQEEAPALGKPVIVTRNTTERPEGIEAGCCILAGTSKAKIIKVAEQLLNDKSIYRKMAKAKQPYGNGDSSKRISRAVDHFLNNSKKLKEGR